MRAKRAAGSGGSAPTNAARSAWLQSKRMPKHFLGPCCGGCKSPDDKTVYCKKLSVMASVCFGCYKRQVWVIPAEDRLELWRCHVPLEMNSWCSSAAESRALLIGMLRVSNVSMICEYSSSCVGRACCVRVPDLFVVPRVMDRPQRTREARRSAQPVDRAGTVRAKRGGQNRSKFSHHHSPVITHQNYIKSLNGRH